MPNDFHIGNRMSTPKISFSGIPIFQIGKYTMEMAILIGSKHPARLFIREWIANKGLDQKRTAEIMDCEPGTLSKLLRGDMGLTTEWIGRIADALDVSPADFFTDPRQNSALSSGVNSPASQRLARAMALLSQLPPEIQDHVLGLVHSLQRPEGSKPLSAVLPDTDGSTS